MKKNSLGSRHQAEGVKGGRIPGRGNSRYKAQQAPGTGHAQQERRHRMSRGSSHRGQKACEGGERL